MKRYSDKPFVTDLLDLLNKPALMNWANKVGLAGQSLADYRKNAMGDGLSNHNQVKKFLADGTPFIDPNFQEKFVAFMVGKTVIASEKRIENEHFSGRYDLKYSCAEGTFICDFKRNQSGMYLENKLQLASYRMVEGCDGVRIVSLPDMLTIDPNITDFRPYEQMLIHLAAIYRLKREVGAT
jgi:hypothetical protein